MARYSNQDISIFNIAGTAWIGDLKNCDIDMNTDTKETKGINSLWKSPLVVAQDIKINGEFYLGSAGAISAYWGTKQAVVVNTGIGTFSGTFLFKTVKQAIKDESPQMQSVTLESDGIVTLS